MTAETGSLITVREAARECRRNTETIRRWIWEGKLPAQKLGNQLFVRRADLVGLASRDKRGDSASRLAALERVSTTRERIERRVGGKLDVLEMLDRSREAHP